MAEKKCKRSVVVPGRSIPPSLSDSVLEFLNHLKAIDMSPATVTKRQYDLLCFQNHLCDEAIHTYQDVSLQVLQSFISRLRQYNYSDHSIESAATSIRCLFRWMEDQAILFENPAGQLKITYHSKKKLGLVLTHEQMARLLDQPNMTTTRGIRDRCILEILYGTGMRLGECEALSVFDLDLTGRTVKVHGKGRKERLLPLGKHAVKYLKLYLQHARAKLIKRSHASKDCHSLWLSRTGAPLSRQTIQKTIKRHSQQADLPAGADTHTLRRSFATHMLQAGAHPIMVSQLLGHSDLKTLSHYLKISIADLTNTHSHTPPGK